MKTAVTDTSIDAFHAHTGSGKSGIQRQRIIDCIEKRGGDWSIGEIAYVLNLQKSTVSARINELLADKVLIVKPHRRDRVSNIKIRPVGLPPTQRGLFQ